MKQISILMFLVCMLAISYAVYAKSSQTFSAGVIAQEQVYPINLSNPSSNEYIYIYTYMTVCEYMYIDVHIPSTIVERN